MFRHILLPLDGSLRAERAIPIAARIAHACEGMLILLRTVSAAPVDSEETSIGSPLFQTAIQSELAEARHYLTRIASARQLAGLPVIVSTSQGSVMAAIQVARDIRPICWSVANNGSRKDRSGFSAPLRNTSASICPSPVAAA